MGDKPEAIEVLKRGGIVIFPTDTVYGIGCRMDASESVKRIFDIKRRNYHKPLLALVDSMEMAEEYVSIPKKVREKVLNVYWPGGLTVILKCNLRKVPMIVRSGADTLAVRLPNHDDIRNIIKQVGVPILATSANFSGDTTPYSISEINKELLSKADFVLGGECTFRKQSTVLDCTVEPWRIVRQGGVKIKNACLFIDTSSRKVITAKLKIEGKEYTQKRKIENQKAQVVLPAIDSLLKKHKMTLEDIGEIEVSTVPGSFTGLRVGMAIGNALSYVLKIPVKLVK
ncbi:MAG: L-threonylcarbamoyladenylate synthase [Patescibacteria group bacterium]